MAKYKLTNSAKKTIFGELRQIEALEDIEIFGVKAGDLGGWIENENNLDQSGNAWVSGDAEVSGDARVYGDARVSGAACVSGDAEVSGDAWVYGDARVSGAAEVSGDARVYGDARVSGDAWVYGAACVSGDAEVSGAAEVSGDAWEETPPYFAKTPYNVYMPTKNTLRVGCQEYGWAEWRKNFKAIARANGMGPKLRDEYVQIFNFFVTAYGDGVVIDPPKKPKSESEEWQCKGHTRP